MADIRIEAVGFLEGYRLDILLSNGHRIIYNLQPKLVTARFADLNQPELFSKGEVIEGRVICWNANTELSLDEILLYVNNSVH